MGKEIEKHQRAREREESWERYMKGESVSSIARTLGRDRRTINKYIEEETELVAREENTEELLRSTTARAQEYRRIALRYLNDPTLRASAMSGPQWLKRLIEIDELALKAYGIIRPGGSAAIQQEGTIVNMVTFLVEDARKKGYRDFEEYLESEDEIVEAEVIED
jgi:predicted transcriptional regulator